MRVEIRCPGRTPFFDKINAAYAYCGPQGSLQTVRALTGVQINYLITVNFRGFRQIVDRLGGAWIDVDRRYFNDRGGPIGYATINLRPGYQQLTGRQTLDYVRYRHTDSDLYRVARQQQFVKAFKGQIQESFAPIALPKVVNAITNNVEVAQGGGVDVDGSTVLSYALFAYGLPRGRVFQTRIEGLEGVDGSHDRLREHHARRHDLHASRRRVVREGHGGRARREARRRAVPAPRATTITVLNGNGVDRLRVDRRLPPRPALVPGPHAAERPAGECADVRLLPDEGLLTTRSRRRCARGGDRRSRTCSPRPSSSRSPRPISQLANGAMLTVVVGQTFHGSLASAPIDQTPKRERPNVVYGPNAAIDELRERRERVPFPLMVPTVIERSSWTDSTMPARMYWIDPAEKHKAVRLVYRMGSNEYWGVQMTDWDDAPVLADKSLTRRIGGRIYDLYYNGPKLHMVVLKTPKADYWVINTLLDRLSNETMIAIAKGLKPLGSVKRS